MSAVNFGGQYVFPYRPNTPVNVIVGGMVLEELMGLTDEEFMDSLLFDIRFQYALHTTSFKEQPVSDRTFSRFRRRCLTYETETGIDLIHDTVKELSGEMAALNFKKLFGYLNSVGQCALIPQIS